MQFAQRQSTPSYRLQTPITPIALPATIVVTAVVMLLGWLLLQRAIPQAVPLEYYLFSAGLAGTSFWLVLHNDRLWIPLVILSLAVFIFREDDGKFGLGEAAVALVASAGLILWFIKEVAIFRRRLIDSPFDHLLLLTWTAALLTSFLASSFHDSNWMTFGKEFMASMMILLYFPLKKYLAEERHLRLLVGMLILLALLNGVHNVLNYQERVIESAMEYGAVNARASANESLSMAMTIICVSLLAASRRWVGSLLALAGAALGVGLVVISLSRTPILAVGVAILAMVALLPPSRGIKVALVVFVALIVNVAALFVIVPGFAESILLNVEDRMASLEQVGGDVSLQSRISEGEALLTEYIPSSPAIGYGFGTFFKFYTPVNQTTVTTTFIHSGFLAALYRHGVFIGGLMLLLMLSPFARFAVRAPDRSSGLPRIVAVGAIGLVIAQFITNLTSNQFFSYIEIVLVATSWAVLDYAIRSGRPDKERHAHQQEERLAIDSSPAAG